ncbi:ATP-dependent nuclease [Parapedobacter koreensis]|uniref:Predicted ATP-dependent endonuclease of the OLD family, contains P-loop ATPase and TOPRIM domains n=1 Tax=Parapedobacter koreensis TaxID=332977 RepID=A0A1H7U483_9SPHI|nr:AAA family ATPase [Parapedobacter koreensis]SEL91912.1 Predicted ATP-dependent endonuclease of the OLD family, contains P-loop ATPase and TOPRIM domains [Parapedobacter koreensis]
MYISKLSIRNFRNFRNISLDFQKGVNTIIGENGSGKTNILYALRLLIDENLPRNIRFYESDFNRSLNQWKGHWIIIQIEFSELDVSEEAQAIAMHKAGTMDEYDSTKGTYSLIFRPRENKRRELYECSQDLAASEVELQAILDSITLNDYELTYRGRGNTDFSIEENYRKYVGDFDKIAFPDPDELEDIYGIRLYGFSIPNELSCTFIKALRDVEADLRSYKDNPLLSLLRGKEKSIDVVKKDSITKKVIELNEEISELEEVRDISGGIANSIKQAVGETYAPNIEIKSEVPSEIERLLQSLKLWVGDSDEPDYKGRVGELSLGGANLIYLSMKLLEYEKVKALNKIANFLLIEEPEAHIHTHIQKTLFDKLHSHNTQVIITTHSTHISSVSKISSVNILSRSNKEALVFNPSNGLEPSRITALERYLDAVRTNLLFAKGVALVEGDAEQILIPVLFKKVFGISLDEIGVSLINIGSTGFQNIATLFHNDRVRKNCAIITDLDTSILELPKDEVSDNVEERAYRNSQKSGALRKNLLDNFCKDNNWVSPFYGKYTFEVEFVKAGNSFEVTQLVNKQYNREADKNRINGLLENNEVNVYGKEVLRLANSFGKGWFALMLEEHIDHLTYIPPYILEAIAFASPHVTNQTLYSIAKYRLKSLIKNKFESDKNDYSDLSQQFEANENSEKAIDFCIKKLPEDQLSKFIKLQKL